MAILYHSFGQFGGFSYVRSYRFAKKNAAAGTPPPDKGSASIRQHLGEMLFLGFFQTPPRTETKLTFHRVYRKHQTDRYAVEVDSEGDGGSAHFDYEVKMVAERIADKNIDTTKVAVSFLNLKGRFGDQEAPVKKLFGAATYQFPATGYPPDYSLGGENSSIVLPILSWYLPSETIEPGDEFKVVPITFDGAFVVAGTGSLISEDAKTAKIKLTLTIASSGSSGAGPHFDSVAVFDMKTGVLQTAEGGLKGGSFGSMSFKLKKI